MKKLLVDWSVMQRQGGEAIVLLLLNSIFAVFKNSWPFFIAILFSSQGKPGRDEFLIIAFTLLVLLRSIATIFFFRFQITERKLIVKSGMLKRKTITLPLEKIAAVHIEQSWLHQLFNLAKVSFDAAGSDDMEVEIQAINLYKAELLRQYITSKIPQRKTGNVLPAMEVSSISLTGKDLLKLCISANHIEAMFLLFAFLLSAMHNITEATGTKSADVENWLSRYMTGSDLQKVIAIASFTIILSLIVSVVRILLRYGQFNLQRSASGFRIRYGFINTTEKLVPYSKIQFLSWKANWIRRKFGLFLLQFHTAGSTHIKKKQKIEIPVTQKRYIDEITDSYYRLFSTKDLIPISVDKRYVWRRLVIIAMPIFIVFFLFFWPSLGWYSLIFSLVIPYIGLTAWLFFKKFKCWTNEDGFQIEKGKFGIEKIILKWNNIQAIKLNQSIYQRSHELATLVIFTAGGTVTLPYINHQVATQFLNYALHKIEYENLPWM